MEIRYSEVEVVGWMDGKVVAMRRADNVRTPGKLYLQRKLTEFYFVVSFPFVIQLFFLRRGGWRPLKFIVCMAAFEIAANPKSEV